MSLGNALHQPLILQLRNIRQPVYAEIRKRGIGLDIFVSNGKISQARVYNASDVKVAVPFIVCIFREFGVVGFGEDVEEAGGSGHLDFRESNETFSKKHVIMIRFKEIYIGYVN